MSFVVLKIASISELVENKSRKWRRNPMEIAIPWVTDLVGVILMLIWLRLLEGRLELPGAPPLPSPWQWWSPQASGRADFCAKNCHVPSLFCFNTKLAIIRF